jgi:hypothetical protein
MPAPRPVEVLVGEMEQLCRVYQDLEAKAPVGGTGTELNRQLLGAVMDEFMSLYSEAKSHGRLDDPTSLRILACMQALHRASSLYLK